jgi:hypothetical protein
MEAGQRDESPSDRRETAWMKAFSFSESHFAEDKIKVFLLESIILKREMSRLTVCKQELDGSAEDEGDKALGKEQPLPAREA